MKVTALIPDELVQTVRARTRGKNITDSLIIALNEWLAMKQVVALNKRLERQPLHFLRNFSAARVRALSRHQ